MRPLIIGIGLAITGIGLFYKKQLTSGTDVATTQNNGADAKNVPAKETSENEVHDTNTDPGHGGSAHLDDLGDNQTKE